SVTQKLLACRRYTTGTIMTSLSGPFQRGRRAAASRCFAAALGLAASMLAAPITSSAAETVTLRLDWLPGGYHAPIFLALQKGYYKAKGIDLEIADGKGT